MLKKLFGVLLLATLVLGVAAPMALAAPAAPVPTPQDLLTRLNSEEQSRTNARTLALQAQGLQAAADVAEGVAKTASTDATTAEGAAKTASTTAINSLASVGIVVVAKDDLEAMWTAAAQVMPGNGQVIAALNAARTAKTLRSVATQKSMEWSTAQTAATTALDKAIAAMPVPPTDPAIARLEGELKEAKTAQVKAEGEVVQLRKELTTEKARADRFETRVGELEKKLVAAPAPVTPPPPVAAPAAAAPWWDATAEVAQLRKERDAAQAALVAAPTQGQLDMAKADLAKVTTERDVAKAAQSKAETEAAELRKELVAAKTAQQAPAPATVAPSATATPAAPVTTTPMVATPATVAPSATAQPATAQATPAVTPVEPMATKASVDQLGVRVTTVEETVKGTAGLKEAVEKLTSAIAAQTAEIATFQTTVAAQATTITGLRTDLEDLQARLRWTWIVLGVILLIGLLFAAVIGIRRLPVILRATRRTADTAVVATATAPVTGGATHGAP